MPSIRALAPETRRLSPTLALILALLGATSMLYYHQALFIPRVLAVENAKGLGNGYSFGNDFYQVWLTARQWMRPHSDLYGPEMTREIQLGLYGHTLDHSRPGDPVDRRVFPYPAFTDLLFWPASQLSFPVARVAFLCLLTALTIASVPIWLRVLDWRLDGKWLAVILLLTLTSYPALEALYVGQLGLLVAFLLAAGILALQKSRFLLAGFLIALTTIKPQITALVIVYLLLWTLTARPRRDEDKADKNKDGKKSGNLEKAWRDRRRFLLGLFSTLTLLVGASLIVSPGWIRSWIHAVLAYRTYTRPPLITEVLTAPLGPRWSPPATFVLTAASLVIAIVLVWRHRAAAANSFAFCLTLSLLLAITTITILPGQAVYDHLILLPGILLLARHRAKLRDSGIVPRTLLLLGSLVLFWPWIAAFALILLRPLVSPALYTSTPIFSLPLRAAAPLPFAVLALLAWTLRLASRSVDAQVSSHSPLSSKALSS